MTRRERGSEDAEGQCRGRQMPRTGPLAGKRAVEGTTTMMMMSPVCFPSRFHVNNQQPVYNLIALRRSMDSEGSEK